MEGRFREEAKPQLQRVISIAGGKGEPVGMGEIVAGPTVSRSGPCSTPHDVSGSAASFEGRPVVVSVTTAEDSSNTKGFAPPEESSMPGNMRKAHPKKVVEMDDAEKKAFYRKRNAMYSRRKYMRKKIEIEVLQTQKAELLNENQLLKCEEKRLVALLEEARRLVEPALTIRGRSAAFSGGARIGATAAGVKCRPFTPGGASGIHSSLPFLARQALLKYQELKNQGKQLQALQHRGSLPCVSSLIPNALPNQQLQQHLKDKFVANLARDRSLFTQAFVPNPHLLQQNLGVSHLDQQRHREWEMIRHFESNRSAAAATSPGVPGLLFPHGIP